MDPLWSGNTSPEPVATVWLHSLSLPLGVAKLQTLHYLLTTGLHPDTSKLHNPLWIDSTMVLSKHPCSKPARHKRVNEEIKRQNTRCPLTRFPKIRQSKLVNQINWTCSSLFCRQPTNTQTSSPPRSTTTLSDILIVIYVFKSKRQKSCGCEVFKNWFLRRKLSHDWRLSVQSKSCSPAVCRSHLQLDSARLESRPSKSKEPAGIERLVDPHRAELSPWQCHCDQWAVGAAK